MKVKVIVFFQLKEACTWSYTQSIGCVVVVGPAVVDEVVADGSVVVVMVEVVVVVVVVVVPGGATGADEEKSRPRRVEKGVQSCAWARGVRRASDNAA